MYRNTLDHRKALIRRYCAAVALASSLAHADVERFGVIIGNNVGAPEDQELRYAENDASKLHDTLKALGGFAPANITLLKGENADTVRRTLIAVNDRVRTATTAQGQAMLVVYYSGHADAAALHLGRSMLPIRELEQLVRGSAASLRLLVLDSCRSGALTRVKGGTPGAPVKVRVEGQLPSEGVLFWTASAANEDAQESDAIRGSFFSHYLNSALVGAGDADADGRVTVEEAYRYASENTVRATSSTFGGTQHPTFQYDLRGQGKLALTTLWDTSRERGAIVVPPGKPFLVFAGSSSGSVIGEVGAADTARRISVKPGSYFVRGRAPDVMLEGTFGIAAGQTREVREDELTRTAYARLVRKGAADRPAQRVELGASFTSTLPNGSGWCYGPYVGYGLDFESLSLGLRASGCRAAYEGRGIGGNTDRGALDLRLAKAIDLLSWLSPYAALDAGAALFRQTFETAGLAPTRLTFGGSFGAALGLTIDLPAGFGLSLEGAAALYVFELSEAANGDRLRGFFAARPAAGLSKTW